MQVFTEAGYQPYVGSTKSLSGHALGAAGVHEAIYSLLMLNRGFLAESANINDLVEEAEGMNILTERYVSSTLAVPRLCRRVFLTAVPVCPLRLVLSMQDGEVNRVMSNSFGFGGTNACLIFDRYTE